MTLKRIYKKHKINTIYCFYFFFIKFANVNYFFFQDSKYFCFKKKLFLPPKYGDLSSAG